MNDNDNGCGWIIAILAILTFLVIWVSISDYYAKNHAMANFQTIVIPIDGAIVNTYGTLSTIWVRTNNGVVPVPPNAYLPQALYNSFNGNNDPQLSIVDDVKTREEQKLLIKKIGSNQLLYEVHLLQNTKPEVNTASHGKFGEW